MPRDTSGLKRDAGPGRPKGSKDSIPKSVKASVRSVLEEVAQQHQADIKTAIVKGINAKPPASLRYLEVMAHYLDGKPAETVKLKGPVLLPPMQVFLHPDGIEKHPTESDDK